MTTFNEELQEIATDMFYNGQLEKKDGKIVCAECGSSHFVVKKVMDISLYYEEEDGEEWINIGTSDYSFPNIECAECGA